MDVETYESHAAKARASARALGACDCIHFAPSWRARVDALYVVANAWIDTLSGRSPWPWWEISSSGRLTQLLAMSPALVADGRMVVMFRDVWFFEAKS